MRHLIASVAIGIAAALVVVLIVVSPWLLSDLTESSDLQWKRLSEIGQTFGAAAAMVAALAFIAASATLVLQFRETRQSREQALRALHMELNAMQLNDPVLLRAVGNPGGDGARHSRQKIYINMWISYWLMRFRMNRMSPANVRIVFRNNIFNGEAGREYWSKQQGNWKARVVMRKDNKFFQIVDEEYARALESGPPAVKAGEGAGRDRRRRIVMIMSIMVGVTVLTYRRGVHRRRRSSSDDL